MLRRRGVLGVLGSDLSPDGAGGMAMTCSMAAANPSIGLGDSTIGLSFGTRGDWRGCRRERPLRERMTSVGDRSVSMSKKLASMPS